MGWTIGAIGCIRHWRQWIAICSIFCRHWRQWRDIQFVMTLLPRISSRKIHIDMKRRGLSFYYCSNCDHCSKIKCTTALKRDAIFGVSHENWPSQKSIYPFLRACVHCEPFSHWTILYSVRTNETNISQVSERFPAEAIELRKLPRFLLQWRDRGARIFRHPWPSTVCSWVLSRTNILTEFLLGILSSITWTWQDRNPSIPSSYLQIW